MHQEQGYEQHTAQQRERTEQPEEAAVPQLAVVGQADREVREPDAQHQGRRQRPVGGEDIEHVAPFGVGMLGAVLERHPAQDQPHQHQQQRQVEPGEQGGVPAGEGREGGAARGQQPHLVAVPGGADGVDHHAAFLVVSTEHGQEHGDAEVEALQEEEADPQNGDQQEPDDVQRRDGGFKQRHVNSPAQYAKDIGASGSSETFGSVTSGRPLAV